MFKNFTYKIMNIKYFKHMYAFHNKIGDKKSYSYLFVSKKNRAKVNYISHYFIESLPFSLA